MFGTHFYHETIKRSVSIFGTLFNNITIKKTKADGTVLAQQIVPISYGPKAKWLARLNEDSTVELTAISLPRLAFEITGFQYDADRQQNKLIRTEKGGLNADKSNRGFQYAPAPYTISFTLSVLAKQANDGLQIVEQILPYFQPEYTVSMKIIDDMSEVRDVPITLTGVEMTDTYEGDFTERRVIEHTLTFDMKIYFFGPIYNGKIIKNVIERTYINPDVTKGFSTTQITESGLVKEVKHYEPAFGEVANAQSSGTTVTFDTAINSSISVGDEVFDTGNATNPTISAIGTDKKSITLSSAITLARKTTLKFVGSVDPEDTFVVAETVNFYDDGTPTTYSDNVKEDAS